MRRRHASATAAREHVRFNGTDRGDDRIWSSEGDDTLRGNDGNDRLEGGDGNDNLIGGLGDDILTDSFGDDILKGGDGNDALSSGQGFGGDLNQGGRGNDFIVGGNDITETFAGPGNDFVFAGDADGHRLRRRRRRLDRGRRGPFDLLQGDNGAPFQDDPNAPGHDVLDGDGGEEDFDAEGGDDIMLAGAGHPADRGHARLRLGDPQGRPAGRPTPTWTSPALLPPAVETTADRFDLVEACPAGISGRHPARRRPSVGDIVAAGDRRSVTATSSTRPASPGSAGLQARAAAGATAFTGGNIIIGGDGSDLIEGRGGDDVIDGDAWLNVRLSVRTDPANPSTEVRQRRTACRSSRPTCSPVTIDPGNIVIVREILDGTGVGTDQALFSDIRAAYECVDISGATPQPLNRCPREWDGRRLTVSHIAGDVVVDGEVLANDGTDTVENVEELVFSDSALPAPPTDVHAVGGQPQRAGQLRPVGERCRQLRGAGPRRGRPAGRCTAQHREPGRHQPPGHRADQRSDLHVPGAGDQRCRYR